MADQRDTSEKPRIGRRKAEIDWDEVEKLLGFQCTGTEVAAFIDVTYNTLEAAIRREKSMKFLEYADIHRGKGRVSLRRTQFKVANDDENVPMLIHLGKTELGQKDTVDLNHGNQGGVPFIIESAPIVHRSLEDDIDDDPVT
jgi:hypothetical protein